MSEVLKPGLAISVVNLSKRFGTEQKKSSPTEELPFWAVKEISFNVKQGQILGIIGHNGAGKSTLLKILAEIIPPTSGYIAYNGSILSILDVGTGFHPDLSGYKNIFLNGSLLGMTKKEITEKAHEIIEFSGIAEHIHEPVKNYSSGMYLRLALSIALFTNNDILLIDEVLSVGDIEFRHKAIQKVKAQAKAGKTCVLVSHDLGSIIELCDECLLMEHGAVKDRGAPKVMVEKYYDIFYNRLKTNRVINLEHHMCRLLSVEISSSALTMNEPIEIKIRYEVLQSFTFLFFLRVNSFHANAMSASNAFKPDLNPAVELSPGIYETSCVIPPELFNAGSYMIDVIIGSENKIFIEYIDACRFKIVLDEWEKDKSWNSSLDLFSFRPVCNWTTLPLDQLQ